MTTLACPRCGGELDGRFYGPCSKCRGQLQEFRPPKPDRVHFSDTTRQDGSHAIAVNVCGKAKCKRKACRQARDEAESVARARQSERNP